MPTLPPDAPELADGDADAGADADADAHGQSSARFRSLTPPSLRWRELLGEDIRRWPAPSEGGDHRRS